MPEINKKKNRGVSGAVGECLVPPENSKIRKRTFDELVVVVLQRRALLRHGCCCFICARHREEIDGSANGGVRRNVVSLAWMQVPAKLRELPAAVDGARKVDMTGVRSVAAATAIEPVVTALAGWLL